MSLRHSDLSAKFGWTATVLAALLLATASPAQSPREPFIVSTAWVAEHLNDPKLVVIHAGAKADYEAGHIPGARFLDLMEISTPHEQGLMMQLPPAEQLTAAFERLGVSNDSRVVVYFARNWVTAAARVLLTLEYLGLGDRASYLDGGLAAWKAEEHPVTTEVRSAAPGKITARVRDDVVVTADWVNANLGKPGMVLLDARTPNFYEGKELGAHAGRLGHIAGAHTLPFTTLVAEETNRFKDRAALEELFRIAGVKRGDLMVTYCHIGMQASPLYWTARSLGYEARMYDGSFEEWSNRKDLPVEGPNPPAPK